MRKEIIISEANDLAVVFEDGRAVEFFLRHGDQLVGDIIWGQVEAVVPGIEAAFVNIGQDRNGFIHVADLPSAQAPRRHAAPKRPTIKVKERILVQIAKAPTGTKGARLTGRLTIPGRFLVLVPHDNRVSISRRIVETHERDRLRRLTLKLKDPGHGVIVRTEAIGRSEEDLRQDIEELIDIWADILHQVQIVNPPSLLHRDSDLIHRVLRDAISADVTKVVVDTASGYSKAREILKGWMPELARNVIHHRGPQPIMDRYKISEELEAAISPKVWLPSGGYLVIEHTEALTVIDVNSGRLTQSKSLADTVLRTNVEAAAEVARQLRLRDIGGIVVIDFISMDTESDRKKVLAAFHEALRQDKSRPQVTGFSEHGLIEVSRRRQGQNLLEQLTAPCEVCGGTGRIRTSNLLPAEPQVRAPRRLEETAALVHEISAEPLATEIILPEQVEEVAFDDEEEEGAEGEEEGEGAPGRRRRRRRRRRGRGAAEAPPLGHILTTTTPEGFTPEDEDEEGFLPPVLVPAEPPRGRERGGRGRGRERVAEPAGRSTAGGWEVEEVSLFEASPLGVEEVALDLFGPSERPERGERGGRDRGGRERGGRDRGGRDRGGRERVGGAEETDYRSYMREERRPAREGREGREPREVREPRPAAAAAAPTEYEVSAPRPRSRRVEVPQREAQPAAAAPVREAREPREVREPREAREPRRAEPRREAPVAAVAAKPAAPVAKPAALEEPKRPAFEAYVPEPAAKAPAIELPETLEAEAVPGLFVLKKKPKAASAAEVTEAKPAAKKAAAKPAAKAKAAPAPEEAVEEAKPAARRATTTRRATKAKAAPAAEAPVEEKPKAKTAKAKPAAKAEEPVAEKPAAKKATAAKKPAATATRRATKTKAEK